tara:strand:- start:44 stop:457 length:414 start_codon:yes stop_codon:yes gene_type:complete
MKIFIIIPVIAFVSCWLLFILNIALMFRTQIKLKKTLQLQAPEIRNNLKLGFNGSNVDHAAKSPFAFFKVLFSFGNKDKTSSFINLFVDLQAIDKSNKQELTKLSNKLIKLLSNSARLWVLGMVCVPIGILTLKLFK